ncbi:hypothetical protein C5167_047929 [Papaver somniferum]|uniref:NAD-dependent epimerase/dehydratase domain-containing protein n=1 Tax=Papaver somniferum TaxID=3469 RepID=A0A4Y7KJB1_PAPSO|nr:hypothetical protein C5167_047929 [Papaver somniferum]
MDVNGGGYNLRTGDFKGRRAGLIKSLTSGLPREPKYSHLRDLHKAINPKLLVPKSRCKGVYFTELLTKTAGIGSNNIPSHGQLLFFAQQRHIQQVAVGRLPELNVYGPDYPTKDGSAVRDYIHVMDLAVISCLKKLIMSENIGNSFLYFLKWTMLCGLGVEHLCLRWFCIRVKRISVKLCS